MTTASLWGVRPPSFWCLVALGLITVAGTPLIAAAQEVVPKAGDRVRVTVADAEAGKDLRYVGNLGGWDEVALRWESAGSPQSAPLDRVTKLELSRGEKSNWLKGGAIGAAAGFVTGFVLFYVVCSGSKCDDSGSPSDRDLRFAFVGGALGAGAGFVLGAPIGAGSRSERWSAVPASSYGGTP